MQDGPCISGSPTAVICEPIGLAAIEAALPRNSQPIDSSQKAREAGIRQPARSSAVPPLPANKSIESQEERRPEAKRVSVANVIIGARNEEQLRQNLGAVGWNLTPEQIARLDAASEVTPVYPYWHQRQFAARNPLPVPEAA